MIGSLSVKDLTRFIMTLIDKEVIDKFPKIVIIGDKKIQDTDLEKLTKSSSLEKKIYYLSVEDGIDATAFKKANVLKCKAVTYSAN